MSQLPLLFVDSTPAIVSYGHPLSDEQARVRDHRGGHQVVVAGAGTGKTETLTQRVLKLLLEGDGSRGKNGGPVELDSVLALTFTDKAAAEMRARVYGGLVRRLRSAPARQERHRLEGLRADFFDRNRILTFDAFNFRLLSQFPELAPLAPGVRVLGEADRARLRRDLTRAFWDRCEGFGEGEKAELWELLARFSSRRAALRAIEHLAENETLDDLAGASQLPLPEVWEAHVESIARAWEARAQARFERETARVWDALENVVASCEGLPNALTEALLDQERITSGGRAGIVTQKGWAAKFENEIPFDFLNHLTREAQPLLLRWKAMQGEESPLLERGATTREAELASRRAVAFLARHALWWASERRAWCERNGVADFSDVAHATLRLLGRPEVARRLRQSTSHILIDEFQDTNWKQWEAIRCFAREAPGNVLLVGDEKQAIFGFRGGDITVFDGVRRELLGEDAPLELTISRRSTPVLVEWVNRAFGDILPGEGERESYEAPFQALESARAGGGGAWKLAPDAWTSPQEGEQMSARALAACATARFLRDLCDDAAHGREPDFMPRQAAFAEVSCLIAQGRPAIALLFTTHDAKGAYEAALRRENVPFVSVKGKGFYSSDPVSLTRFLLRALLDGGDELALAALLRSPLGGASDVALLERHLDVPPSVPADASAVALLESRLDAWRCLARVAPISDVLERALENSELAFYEAGLPDAAQRRENWRKVLELLRGRETEGEGGLRALIDYLNALASEGDAEADAALPTQGSIQLMTAHAAKGLGFPMTILAQLDRAPLPVSDDLLRDPERPQWALKMANFDAEDEEAKPPLLWQMFAREQGARNEAEWRRLFYVACTRAEDHMVLVWPASQKNGSWAQMCARAAQNLPLVMPSLQPRHASATQDDLAPERPVEPAPPGAFASEEIGLTDLCGTRDETLSRAAVRGWFERHVPAWGGDPARGREDVPFCVPASELGVAGAQWVFGSWEWLFPLEDSRYILGATGEKAEQRARFMAGAARCAGLELASVWTLKNEGEGVVGESVVE